MEKERRGKLDKGEDNEKAAQHCQKCKLLHHEFGGQSVSKRNSVCVCAHTLGVLGVHIAQEVSR